MGAGNSAIIHEIGSGTPRVVHKLGDKEKELIIKYYKNGREVAATDAFGNFKIGETIHTYTADGNPYGSFGLVKAYRVNNFNIFIPTSATAAEMRAIETLREMITETEYRKYIVHGFIHVKGRSGYIYQVFRNRTHTKVWKKGLLIKEVCFKIKDPEIPPTDNVIAHKILIETSEEEFERLGNVYKMNRAA